MIIKFQLSIAFIIPICFFGISQNLVPNSSFETINTMYCGIHSSQDFDSTFNDWYVGGASSPEVYSSDISNACYNFQPFSQYSGPIGIKGNQIPRSGKTMVGLGMYSIPTFNQREYIQVKLDTHLDIGSKYSIEFYVSLADSVEFYINKIGAHLSLNPVSGSGQIPQVESRGFISDYTGWVKISDTITATSNLRYLTIGNFRNDANTGTTLNPNRSGSVGSYGSYYFIDDVSVVLVSSSMSLNEKAKNNFTIFPTLANEYLTIDTKDITEAYSIIIIDNLGRAVYSAVSRSNLNKINVSSFSKGIYYVLIENNEFRTLEKFIKSE